MRTSPRASPQKVIGFELDQFETRRVWTRMLTSKSKGVGTQGQSKGSPDVIQRGLLLKLLIVCVNTSKIGCAWEYFQALE